MKKIPVIAVVGPTASGKTEVSIKIAKKLGGEIISADSMQIYKGMSIATAKPSPDEMQGIPHHLIDFLPVDKKFSVADFVAEGKRCIEKIYASGALPIVVGGTGLYIDSLLQNLIFSGEKADEATVNRLSLEFDSLGGEEMLSRLRKVDPQTADRLHTSDKRRIVRALALYECCGITMTRQYENSRAEESPYNAFYIGINYRNRDILYDRINRRVDIMLKKGLLDEAKEYYDLSRETTACQAIGYKELAPYFNGSMTLAECTENLKRETRRYAKRQLTWFRRNENIHWLYADDYDSRDSLYKSALQLSEGFLRSEENG